MSTNTKISSARLDVIDEVFDELLTIFSGIVKEHQATSHEAVLALTALLHEVLDESEIVEYVTD